MICPSCQTQVDESQRFCPACGAALAGAAAPAPASQDVLIGQTLGGKYRVVRLLGEGGMGAVYEGEQQLGTTKRKVAVKTLHPHLSRDPKIKARFEREVGTVAELEHPNTIQVFDFGSTGDDILYIVMEFLQGKSLAATLEQEGAMAPERVDRILQQVCGSLEEAHGRGIVHRDLKPDNVVLVDRAGKKDFVKVLDFGIAKRSSEEDRNEQKLTQQGMVLGTPPYMSPEQFTGKPIDARSDIYSLGVMAYEMLTGRLPFQATTAWEWATQHMTQPPIPIESLAEGMRAPEAMRSAIKRALAKAPEDRFQKVKDFADAFSGLAAPASPGASTQAVAAAQLGRQKTELGTPLQAPVGGVGAGAPVPWAGSPPGPGAAGPAGMNPTQGNVSFPTPAAIPQPPPRSGPDKGGSRALLLGLAALIGLASIGAIVFAMRGRSGGSSGSPDFGASTSPAAPDTTIAAPSDGDGAPSAATGAASGTGPTAEGNGSSDVPPLSGGNAPHTAPHGASPHPSPGPAPGPAPRPGPGTTPNPTPVAPPPQPQVPVAPPAPPAPPAPNPAKYDGPECQTARKLRALGHAREAQSWALACTAKGGTP